jgi:hypothetical protein
VGFTWDVAAAAVVAGCAFTDDGITSGRGFITIDWVAAVASDDKVASASACGSGTGSVETCASSAGLGRALRVTTAASASS